MAKLPYISWYTGDWLKDPAVSVCSPATRGIWFDLLCAMHELDQCGEITGTIDQLSRIARCTVDEMRAALEDIKSARVAKLSQSSNGRVTLVNRRMNKAYEERKNAANRQKNRRKRISEGLPETEDVTKLSRQSNALSSSSSSSSSSFSYSKDLKVRHRQPNNQESIQPKNLDDDGLRNVSESDFGIAGARFRAMARKLKPSEKQPQRAKDLDLLAKSAVLSVIYFSEDWLADAISATLASSNKRPMAYFYTVLASKSENFNRLLASIKIPPRFFEEIE